MKFRWINFLKGAAMLAVIFDHLFSLVYTNDYIHRLTIYSVTLFIFLAGFTSSISLGRTRLSFRVYIYKRLAALFIPYLIATVVYHIVYNNFYFDFNLFKEQVIMFNASGPFYFVLFFMQLVVISPLLYKLFLGRRLYQQLIILFLIYLLSSYLTHYTSIANYYGGAGKILGGSYLFVFSLGIFFQLRADILSNSTYRSMPTETKRNIIGLVVSLLFLGGYLYTGQLASSWANPPNKFTLVYTILVSSALFFAFEIIRKKTRVLSRLLTPIEMIGENSLYIFLYHSLFIYLGLKWGLMTLSYGKILLPLFTVVFSTFIGFVLPLLRKKIISFVNNQ